MYYSYQARHLPGADEDGVWRAVAVVLGAVGREEVHGRVLGHDPGPGHDHAGVGLVRGEGRLARVVAAAALVGEARRAHLINTE